MLNVRVAADHLYWEFAVHLDAADDVYNDVFLCGPFSHEMSWMRPEILLSELVSEGFPTYSYITSMSLIYIALLTH